MGFSVNYCRCQWISRRLLYCANLLANAWRMARSFWQACAIKWKSLHHLTFNMLVMKLLEPGVTNIASKLFSSMLLDSFNVFITQRVLKSPLGEELFFNASSREFFAVHNVGLP